MDCGKSHLFLLLKTLDKGAGSLSDAGLALMLTRLWFCTMPWADVQ